MFERIEETLPVVTIKTENGNVRINASDYDPEKHELADGEEVAASTSQEPEPPAPVAQEPVTQPVNDGAPQTATRVAQKIGAKWFVVDTEGNKIEAEGINAAGYKTEAEAWAAAMPSIA